MINQKWKVVVDDAVCIVEYKCTPITGKTELIVDGTSFAVKGKPFGIGLERREIVLIGGTQGILDVKKGGKAELIVREGEVEPL